jgi:two-component system, cell cycle sensor histidine kinase and response regulator CckA
MVRPSPDEKTPSLEGVREDARVTELRGMPSTEDAYRALAAASPYWMYELDRDGVILSMNPAGLRLVGAADERAVVGRPLMELCDPADAEKVARMVERALDGKRAQFDFTGSIRGEKRTFSTVLIPLRDEREGVVRLLGQTQDITDFLRAETAAQESEARFYQAFQSAPCLMIISSLEDYRFIDVNDMFVEASGFRRDEVLGNRDDGMPEVFADRALHDDMLARLAGGERVTSVQTRYRCKNGDVRDALVSIEPIRVDGESCAVWQALDVTERLRDEARRLELEAQLQQRQRLESLGLLAGSIAHDFNNLLGAILANADLALRKTDQTERGELLLGRIRGATMHASELTSQMLAYSGRARLNEQAVDLNDLVQDMMRLLEVTLPKNARFGLHLLPNLPRVRADAAQIRQVLMNLVTNASEALEGEPGEMIIRTGAAFLDEESLRRTLTGSVPVPGRYCLLAVSDTGCGMDADTRARIFDPFFTTKRDGRGLGLAAAIGIVRGHGGVIDIDSELGVGTTFSVWLPCARADELPIRQAPEAHEVELPEHAPFSTVLVVDDDPRFLEAAVDMVSGLGFTTLSASTGSEAIATFRANAETISAVLLDVLMPDYDGWDVLRSLRAIRADVPVVLMSGYVPEPDRARIGREETEGFLQKPFLLEELQRALRSTIRASA